MGDGGLLRGPGLQLGALCCPWGVGKWPRETGRKFGSPQRALSTCFLTAGEASARSRFTRGRKGRAVFFLPFPFSACPSASVGLVSAFSVPSLLPHTVCVSVCLCYVFSMSPAHPSCLNPTPLVSRPSSLGTGFWPSVQTHFPACARPARAKWLNLQPMFSSYLTDVAQDLGWKGPRVHWWGQDGEGRSLVCYGHS